MGQNRSCQPQPHIPSEIASSYRVAVKFDDRCRVEVVERLHLTPRILLVLIGRVRFAVGRFPFVVGRFLFVLVFEFYAYEPRNEQWKHETRQYLTVSRTT